MSHQTYSVTRSWAEAVCSLQEFPLQDMSCRTQIPPALELSTHTFEASGLPTEKYPQPSTHTFEFGNFTHLIKILNWGSQVTPMNGPTQAGNVIKVKAIKGGAASHSALARLVRNKSNYHLYNLAGPLHVCGRKQFQNFISYIECR